MNDRISGMEIHWECHNHLIPAISCDISLVSVFLFDFLFDGISKASALNSVVNLNFRNYLIYWLIAVDAIEADPHWINKVRREPDNTIPSFVFFFASISNWFFEDFFHFEYPSHCDSALSTRSNTFRKRLLASMSLWNGRMESNCSKWIFSSDNISIGDFAITFAISSRKTIGSRREPPQKWFHQSSRAFPVRK